jgi:hypothetical protein
MFKITGRDKRSDLEKGIDEKIQKLFEEAEKPEQLEEVLKLIKQRQGLNEKKRPSPDAWLTFAGSLAGICLILWHEKADVITSKAMGWVMRGRV